MPIQAQQGRKRSKEEGDGETPDRLLAIAAHIEMDDELRLTFPGGPDAPTRARFALVALDGALADIRETIRLLVTELVSNSVLHAGADDESTIELKVVASADVVRVEVKDRGPGFEPVPAEPDRRRGGGFGLFLVNKLADRWGVEAEQPTRVWFEVDRRETTSVRRNA
jgi:anti-sigma regulatory factor (Ser/Thr protein kinase)